MYKIRSILLAMYYYLLPGSWQPTLATWPLSPPRGSEWIISIGDYVDNSFTALGSSDPREVRL